MSPPQVNIKEVYERLRRWASDPYEFISEAVYTKDQVSVDEPVKKAPTDRPYIKAYCRLWEREKITVLVKSRRMWMSWLVIALYLWDALFHKYRDIYFVSDKSEKSDTLVERAKFILDNIPEELWPKDLRPAYKRIEGHLMFTDPKHQSNIHAVAQGKDQLRQETASGLLFDEFGFWPLAEESYTAAKPVTDGGGRLTVITTPPEQKGIEEPFVKKLFFDTDSVGRY